MKTLSILICLFIMTLTSPLRGASNTFIDYQNYNHGYCSTCNCYPCHCGNPAPEEDSACPTCNPNGVPLPTEEQPPPPAQGKEGKACTPPNPCDPAPTPATECGLSLWWVGIALAVIATAASILVTNNNGKTPDKPIISN